MATSKKAAELAAEIPQEPAVAQAPEIGETPQTVPDGAPGADSGPEELLEGMSGPLDDGLPDGYVFQEYAVTHPVGLRLRAEPSLDAPVLAVLPHGVGVWTDTIYDRELEWIYVRTGLLAGWVMARHLAPVED